MDMSEVLVPHIDRYSSTNMVGAIARFEDSSEYMNAESYSKSASLNWTTELQVIDIPAIAADYFPMIDRQTVWEAYTNGSNYVISPNHTPIERVAGAIRLMHITEPHDDTEGFMIAWRVQNSHRPPHQLGVKMTHLSDSLDTISSFVDATATERVRLTPNLIDLLLEQIQ